MKKFLLSSFIVILLLTLQATVGEFIEIFGVQPDMLLVLTCLTGLWRGKNTGGLYGVMTGMFQDLLYGSFIGLNALTKGITGYFVGIGALSLYKGNLIIPFVVVFTASIFHEVMKYCVLMAFNLNPSFLSAFLNAIVPFSIYNSFIALVFFKPVKKLNVYFASL